MVITLHCIDDQILIHCLYTTFITFCIGDHSDTYIYKYVFGYKYRNIYISCYICMLIVYPYKTFCFVSTDIFVPSKCFFYLNDLQTLGERMTVMMKEKKEITSEMMRRVGFSVGRDCIQLFSVFVF